MIKFYNSNNEEILTNGQIINIATSRPLTFLSQPIESGTPITDHVIENNTIITCDIISSYNEQQNLHYQLTNLVDNLTPIKIQTRSKSFDNVYITNITSISDNSKLNTCSFSLRIEKLILVFSGTVDNVKDDKDKSTQNRGDQIAKNVQN